MSIQIKEKESLKKHSTFRIGGLARYFVVAKSKDEVLEAIEFAKKSFLPFVVIGGGSNILFRDEGYEGVVIRFVGGGWSVDGDLIHADAGVSLGALMMASANAGLSGLEWAAGIPGTIGGAVNGNCGAYGRSISNNIESVEVLTTEGEIKKYSNEECGFIYRGSNFKKPENQDIILDVVLKLISSDAETVKAEIKSIMENRKGKVPSEPSAGDIFKNFVLGQIEGEKEFLKVAPSEGVVKGKYAVKRLLSACNFGGKQIGQAKITESHTNFIVNLGDATAKDVLSLIDICRDEVKQKFGVNLDLEIVII